MMKVSIVGLGKLGLPFALTFAQQGCKVYGVDLNKELIGALCKGDSNLIEPHVSKCLNRFKRNLTFSSNFSDAILKSNITFIVVPTPSKKDGSFSSKYIEEAIKTMAPFLKKKKQKHILVITSTVSPGTMEGRIKPLIEKVVQKKVGSEIGLCYSPELIALGSVIHNLTYPDFLFIGESDKDSGSNVENVRKKICENQPKVIRTNWINAELIKLSLNAYITTKISFANMVARISEHIPEADSGVILNAIGKDSRVGAKYLKGGLGFGGPCFPRDNLSLYSTIKKVGLNIDLPKKIDSFNRSQIEYVFNIIQKYCLNKVKVGILGLSYKPDTNVVDESQGVLLAKKSIKEKIPVVVFDPWANETAKKILKKAFFARTINECIEHSELIVLTTAWKQFSEINWDQYKGKIIIDCWRQIQPMKYDNTKNKFIRLGTYIPSS